MPRKYKLKARAERQAHTRQRIVDATVELHATVGPARTTVSAIAEKAGVERKTFYRHFPDAAEVFAACSARFRELNPPPDPGAWPTDCDSQARVRHGLIQVYGYYRRHQQLISNVLRDRELGLPVGEGFIRHRAACKQALADGFDIDRTRRRRLLAALELALDFRTWQTLAHAQLSDHQAAELTAALVAHSASAGTLRPRVDRE
jgi:AcrR family transcriptional regulator